MNLLLVTSSDRTGEATARIVGDRHRHIRRILKLRVGDRLRAGEVGGLVGWATITATDQSSSTVALDLCHSPPPPLPVRLFLALPRPKFLGRILQSATAMGCKSIVLFQSARVEKTYWDSRTLVDDSIERHVLLGLSQARDTVPPSVQRLRTFNELLSTLEISSSPTILLAEADAKQTFPRQRSGPTDLIVGPEGGLLDHEIDALASLGAKVRSLGARTLTVETAVAALLARLC